MTEQAKCSLRTFILVSGMLAALSCRTSSPPKGIAGTWEGNLRGHRAVCTYKDSGEFTRNVEAGMISLEFDGSYVLKGDTITEKIKTARIGGRPSLSPSINAMLNKPIETHFRFDGRDKLIISDLKGNNIVLYRK